MTRVAPVGAGTPDPLDFDARDQLQHSEQTRLPLVRSRAEKWIGGIGALTGVLATALVIKGPADATKIILGWRIAAAGAVGGALVLLALGTYRAYKAAFGEPNALREISPDPLTGLHRRLTQARQAAAKDALHDLATAIKAVFAAVALIATAVAITWSAPTTTSPKASGFLCIYTHGRLTVHLNANSIAVHAIAPGTTITPCA